ncbi:MAG TPA: bifunctional diguanylate cyclase/phosphodiesterase [Kineosporiaceae bacterium]|nr:bifunctional diguanylate cyclase/phosphodiesterase [Kineosporiaceae bacterium]
MLAAAVPAWYGLSDRPWQAFSTGLFLSGIVAVITALILIVWWFKVRRYRNSEPFRLVIAVAMLCWGAGQVVADLSVITSTDAGRPRLDPWPVLAFWCLAWPLIGLGVIRLRPRQTSTALGRASARRLPTGGGLTSRLLTGRVLASGVLASRGLASRVLASRGLASRVLAGGVLASAVLAGVWGSGLLTGGGLAGGLLVGGVLISAVLIVSVRYLREVLNPDLHLRLTAGLRAQAFRDSLTGLPNRRALTTRIDELGRDDLARVVLTLDLDGFKQVNDLLGHHAGDALLVAVAEALQAHCPPQALIARVGGDEFALLCPGDLARGRELGEQLRAAVAQTLAVLAPGVGISASVGVGRLVRPEIPVRTSEHRDQLTGLVESAAALRAAKQGGGDSVQVYDGQVARDRDRRLLLEHRLRLAIAVQAIADQTIITFGQPIVDLSTGRLTGFESLARWTDDELGNVEPEEFIEVAEQTGLIVALGEHLLAQTLAAAANAGVFGGGLTLSVNVSPIQLRVPGFVMLVRELLDRHRISSDQLIIEITEAILVTEGDSALSTLAELNALGIGLAIDDFGTGYAALGYLRRLPVQVIKIDKSLTNGLLSEAKTLAIVEGIAQMAHRMGIRVVMEGIEKKSEADKCRAAGADRGQGYLFGRPIPWAQAAKLVPPASTIMRG